MKRVLGIVLLLVLFCVLILPMEKKEVVKVIFKYNESEIVYYYEFIFRDDNAVLSAFVEE